MGNLIDTDGLDQYTDEITTFTSGDSSSPSSFTDIAVVASKEKPSSLFQKLSQAIRNIRVLRNQVNVTTNVATPVAASANANNSVAIGYGAYANSSAVAIGYNANVKYSAGIAIGGNSNSASSISIGYYSYSGTQSIAIGSSTNAYGGQSVILGDNAKCSSSDAIAIGFGANASNNYAIAIGSMSVAQGEGSIAIRTAYVSGFRAVGIMGNANGTNAITIKGYANGNYSTALGSGSSATGNYSTALGYDASTTEANTIQLGDYYVSSLKCRVQLTVTSDVRDKTDIEPIPNAINFLNEIEPITYVSNMRSWYEYDFKEEVQNEDGLTEIIDNNPYKDYGFTPYDKEEHAKGTKKGERRRSGVSAQNVREAMIKIYGTDNYANLINDDMYDRENVPPEVESHLGVQYECFVPFLIKAIQELDARVKELEGQAWTNF